MSLLLRRRALMASAAEEIEGGGPNDGKYVVFINRSGQNNNKYVYSTNFGSTYQLSSTAVLAYSCSKDLDSSGSLHFQSTTVANSGSIIKIPVAPNTPITMSRLDNPNSAGVMRAQCWSNDRSKALFIRGQSSISVLGLNKLYLWTKTTGEYTGSITLIGNAPYTSSANFTDDQDKQAGPLLIGNRDSLQYLICGSSARIRRGAYYAASVGWISRDGGYTWTSAQDAVFSTSSQGDTEHLRCCAISDNGKHSLLVFNPNDNTAPVLGKMCMYHSSDYMQTWNKIETIPVPSGHEILSVAASSKFKTIYASTFYWNPSTGNRMSCSLWRSQDFGQSWTRVKYNPFGATYPIWCECNAAGDKIIMWPCSENTTTFATSASVDYGTTWTRRAISNITYFNYHTIDMMVSRDSI